METNSIRSKYLRALEKFDTLLEPLEEKYRGQLKKLVTFAKEDPELAREIGKLEILITEKEKMFHDYFKSEEEQTPQHIKSYFPRISSFGKDALFDFYQCFSNLGEKLPLLMKSYEPSKKDNSLTSLVFVAETKNYSFSSNKRRMLIPKLFTKEVNKKITDEVVECKHGMFLLVPADTDVRNAQKITRYKQCLLVRECKKTHGYYDSSYWKTVKKDEATDAILYRCNPDTYINHQSDRNKMIGVKVNFKSHDASELLRPFVRNNYTEKYLEQYIKNMEKFNDDINFIFNLLGKNELYFKFGDKNVVIKK